MFAIRSTSRSTFRSRDANFTGVFPTYRLIFPGACHVAEIGVRHFAACSMQPVGCDLHFRCCVRTLIPGRDGLRLNNVRPQLGQANTLVLKPGTRRLRMLSQSD